MNAVATISTIPAYNAYAFDDAVQAATKRAFHSFFDQHVIEEDDGSYITCLLYTSPSPRDGLLSRMPSSA